MTALYSEDPRAMNKCRHDLVSIVQSLIPPANFKIVLEVEKETNLLLLRILKRQPSVYKFFGLTFWHHTPSWSSMDCEQRRLVARTYEDMIAQLKMKPEFLEFEFQVEGECLHQVALNA